MLPSSSNAGSFVPPEELAQALAKTAEERSHDTKANSWGVLALPKMKKQKTINMRNVKNNENQHTLPETNSQFAPENRPNPQKDI